MAGTQIPLQNDVLLPFRATLERRGYTVFFDGKHKTALALKDGWPDLFVDYSSMEAWIGSRRTEFEVRMVNGRIYVDAPYFSSSSS